MTILKNALMAGFAALIATSGVAHADYLTGSVSVRVFTGDTNGAGFNALPGVNPFTAPVAAATFTYTGALDFSNAAAQNTGPTGDLNSTFFASAGSPGPNYGISNFVTLQGMAPVTGLPGIANYDNVSDFLASSGSGAGYAYGSYYTIDLGTLAAGTVLTITHDDGASVFQGSTQVGTTTFGPTGVVTNSVELTGSGDTTLYYTRQNGTPSILEVAVPEPVSMSVLGMSLVGLGLVRRRRNNRA
jgi:hypothetical protein